MTKYKIKIDPASSHLFTDSYYVLVKRWWFPIWTRPLHNFWYTKAEAEEYMKKLMNPVLHRESHEK